MNPMHVNHSNSNNSDNSNNNCNNCSQPVAFDDTHFQYSCCSQKETKLKWTRAPKRVLMIKKRDDPDITKKLVEMALWLSTEHGITPLVEASAKEEIPQFESIAGLRNNTTIDFVVCLGGDGVLLHVNSLFGERVPPVVAFFYGTLGFLTPFHIENYKEVLTKVIEGEAFLTLRSRLHCKLHRNSQLHESFEESIDLDEFHVLNEAVIDRGNSPYMADILCFCNEVQITTVRADGIIIGSPTGSTAYSLSAGASITHPLVPGIIFTPICPHTLSFRPVVFPDCVKLKFQVTPSARSSGWVSFDGRLRKRLDPDEYVTVETSRYPFPSVSNEGVLVEWFKGLANIFHWNDRPTH